MFTRAVESSARSFIPTPSFLEKVRREPLSWFLNLPEAFEKKTTGYSRPFDECAVIISTESESLASRLSSKAVSLSSILLIKLIKL